MTDYCEVDWQQAKPRPRDLNTDWPEVRINQEPSDDPRMAAVVDELRRTHENGEAVLGRFSIEAPPSWRWYLSRNRLDEAELFHRFYEHAAVKEVLGPLGERNFSANDLGFRLEQPYVATGRLAGIVASGGAYIRFGGSDKELLRLIRAFTEAVFDDRYSDMAVFVSFACWSSWFKGIAWDASFFWFDKKTGIATTLLVTDTD